MEELKLALRVLFIIIMMYCMVGVWAGYDQDGVGW